MFCISPTLSCMATASDLARGGTGCWSSGNGMMQAPGVHEALMSQSEQKQSSQSCSGDWHILRDDCASSSSCALAPLVGESLLVVCCQQRFRRSSKGADGATEMAIMNPNRRVSKLLPPGQQEIVMARQVLLFSLMLRYSFLPRAIMRSFPAAFS